jgi:hypothetical protein
MFQKSRHVKVDFRFQPFPGPYSFTTGQGEQFLAGAKPLSKAAASVGKTTRLRGLMRRASGQSGA